MLNFPANSIDICLKPELAGDATPGLPSVPSKVFNLALQWKTATLLSSTYKSPEKVTDFGIQKCSELIWNDATYNGEKFPRVYERDNIIQIKQEKKEHILKS